MTAAPFAVAAASAAAAIAAARPARGRLLRVLRPGPRRPLRPAGGLGLVVPVAAAGGWLVAGPVAAVLAAAGAVVAVRRRVGARRGREEAATRTAVVAAVTALAAELRAGQGPAAALEAVADEAGPLRDVLAEAAAAAATGGDPAALLRHAAGRPGADGLHPVAACWEVGAGAGAGAADALDALAAALRRREQLRARVAAELAGPRATARALVALPALGVAMAAALGAHPVALLLHTPVGGALCAGALLLDTAGFLWIQRLVRAAEPP